MQVTLCACLITPMPADEPQLFMTKPEVSLLGWQNPFGGDSAGSDFWDGQHPVRRVR